MLVVFIGDSHGNTQYLKECFEYAHSVREQANEDVLMISVGDFGFWPDSQRFVKYVKMLCAKTGVPLWVIDGNHDFPGEGDRADGGYLGYSETDPKFGETEFCHLPRGTTFTLGDTTFLAFGGAVSIDRARRVEGRSYWKAEEVTGSDVQKALDNIALLEDNGQSVDVMVSHDSCVRPPGFDRFTSGGAQLANDLDESIRRVHKVWSAARPPLLIHGHWHHRYEAFREFDLHPFDERNLFGVQPYDADEKLRQEVGGRVVGLGFEKVSDSLYTIQV